MKCKKCNNQLEKENLFCPYCGTKVEQDKSEMKMQVCKFCGEKIEEGDFFANIVEKQCQNQKYLFVGCQVLPMIEKNQRERGEG